MATQIERLALRPAHAAGARLRKRPDDGGWVLECNACYVQLSPAALALWQLCDGERTWAQVAARYQEVFGVDGTASVLALATMLEERGFFAAAEARETTSVSRGRGAKATELYVSWSPEVVVEKLYAVTRWAFRPLGVTALAALALAGAVRFCMTPHAVNLHGGYEQLALALAIVSSVALHEAGHALTLRHFGGAVRRAGIGWYWFAPVAFVDTSDVHMLARGNRIAVSLAGPFASVFVAGCASLVAAFTPAPSVAAVAWSLAAFTYVATLWNFNPLLQLDGYYVLADLLQRPNLRRDAAEAVCGRRRDSVAFAYALGALAYGATVVCVTIPSAARMTIVAWLPATVGEPIRAAVPIAVAFIAFLAVAHSYRSIFMEAVRSRSVARRTCRTARDA